MGEENLYRYIVIGDKTQEVIMSEMESYGVRTKAAVTTDMK